MDFSICSQFVLPDEKIKKNDDVILWFDACLFDQSMLCHILSCMRILGIDTADLLCGKSARAHVRLGVLHHNC